MHQHVLKKIRVVLSLVFFFLTLFVFLDFTHLITGKVIRSILWLQFVPSLVRFITFLTVGSAGFLFITLLTLLFGRVYCSSVCPLGTVLDIFARTGRLFRRKKGYRKQGPFRAIQYAILGIAALPVLAGNLYLLGLLDPYSLSGKIFTQLVRPVYYGANNLLNRALNAMDIYSLYPVPLRTVSLPALLFTALVAVSVFLLAAFKGRWYCNVICPVGGLLRIFSKFSLFKIAIDEDQCTSCGLCLKKCKAGCIDFREKTIDFERCVVCFDCFAACPEGGIHYKVRSKKYEVRNSPTPGPSPIQGEKNAIPVPLRLRGGDTRRNFLKTLAAGTAVFTGSGLVGKTLGAETKDARQGVSETPVTPPGSQSIWHYTDKCTACHLCISACPTKVIQPAFLEYGLAGLFQPRMDFRTSFCNFECTVCTEVCPTGALLPVTKEQKKTLQIGVSTFIKNTCVVVSKHTACGACSEHCPTKAVEMVPYLGSLKIPRVDEKICVGCGACEYACPTKPVKAIYVEANRYHRKAQKPMKKVDSGIKRKAKPDEDFPF